MARTIMARHGRRSVRKIRTPAKSNLLSDNFVAAYKKALAELSNAEAKINVEGYAETWLFLYRSDTPLVGGRT
jgi:hypothetical protein